MIRVVNNNRLNFLMFSHLKISILQFYSLPEYRFWNDKTKFKECYLYGGLELFSNE